MAIIKDDRMPCSITDGPQEDGWVDDVDDMEPLAFLELAIERLPEGEIFDWFADELLDVLDPRGGSSCVSKLLHHRINLEDVDGWSMGFWYSCFEEALERMAKKMMENEDVARRVFSRD